MLPKKYAFVAMNKTGQTLTYTNGARIAISIVPWKFDSSGVVVYGTEITDSFNFDTNGQTIVDGVWYRGGPSNIRTAEIDNATNKYIGFHAMVTTTTDNVSSDGTIDIFYETIPNGTDAPSDAGGFHPQQDLTFLCSLTHDLNETKSKDFEV